MLAETEKAKKSVLADKKPDGTIRGFHDAIHDELIEYFIYRKISVVAIIGSDTAIRTIAPMWL